jgi:hypothetical protein
MGDGLTVVDVLVAAETYGTFPVVAVVPLLVTVVCAAAPADANAKQKPNHMHADLLIIPILPFE